MLQYFFKKFSRRPNIAILFSHILLHLVAIPVKDDVVAENGVKS